MCNADACRLEATHRPVICVPFFGMDLSDHMPSRIVPQLFFCEAHSHQFKAAELDCETLRRSVEEEHRVNNVPLPDFARMWVEVTPVDSVLSGMVDRCIFESEGRKLS